MQTDFKTFFNSEALSPSSITIKDRKSVEISGIKQIDSFDNQEFLLDTVVGYLHVKGKNLTLGKMDNDNKEVVINGNIDSINYVESMLKGTGKEKLMKKLFK